MHASAPLLQGHRKPVRSIESFEFDLSTAMPCHERVGNGVFARTVVESLLTTNGGWIGNLSCSRATTWFDRVCQWISGKLHEYPSTHRWSSALLRSCTGAGRWQEAPSRRTTRADGPACRYHVCDGGGAHSGDTMRPDGVQHFLVAIYSPAFVGVLLTACLAQYCLANSGDHAVLSCPHVCRLSPP